MSTRTIVTSQPDVACEVCARRLLRGEQPDVFIAAGRRLTVCELCAPRAAHEGWLRESDAQSVSLPPMRSRRGRSLLDRLPVPLRVPARFRARPTGTRSEARRRADELDQAGSAHASASVEPYDLLGGLSNSDAPGAGETLDRDRDPLQPVAATQAHELGEWDHVTDVDFQPAPPAAGPPSYVQQALDAFNASEFPRRVAGVARSLGPPSVTARSAEHLDSVVTIVVAWELCWYRYEVDLSESGAEAQAIGQGTELDELAREDRLANAGASDSGELALVAV